MCTQHNKYALYINFVSTSILTFLSAGDIPYPFVHPLYHSFLISVAEMDILEARHLLSGADAGADDRPLVFFIIGFFYLPVFFKHMIPPYSLH